MARYDPIHESSAVQQLQHWLSKFQFVPGSGPDGLVVTPPEEYEGPFDFYADIPPRLREWLVGLRLLRGVPLAHLVPDPALLPPESIRFFHVDPTWVDRLVDGALSVAGVGTSDLTFAAAALTLVRDGLDHMVEQIAEDQDPDVSWSAGSDPMTGMLVRSELVRRWPELVVRAKQMGGHTQRSMAVLRKEAISRDVMIVLFAGQPDRVEVREPDVAMRFGVEAGNTVNLRSFDGDFAESGGAPVELGVHFRNQDRRVLNVARMAQDMAGHGDWDPGTPGRSPGARDIAINLEQLPYVQIFSDSVPEEDGSKPGRTFGLVQGVPSMVFRHGRHVAVSTIQSRFVGSKILREED